MKEWTFSVVGAATIALLVGPATALAQDEGSAKAKPSAEATVVQSEPVAGPAEGADAAGTPDTSSEEVAAPPEASEDTDPATSGVSDTAALPQPEAQVEASTPAPDTAAADSGAGAGSSEPVTLQAEASTSVSVSQRKRRARASRRGTANYSRCGALASTAVAPRAVPTGPGCGNVIPRGQISTDPANPTVFTVNGVTFGVWTVDRPNGSELDWQIISGAFPGTDAVNITILQGLGPTSPTAVCQISNAAPTGSCHLPARNNGKWWPLNHIVICSASTTVPPPAPVNGPGSGGGAGGNAGAKGNGNGNAGVAGAETGASEGTFAAASAAAAAGTSGAELPFTGLSVVSLLLLGACLLSGGAALHARID